MVVAGFGIRLSGIDRDVEFTACFQFAQAYSLCGQVGANFLPDCNEVGQVTNRFQIGVEIEVMPGKGTDNLTAPE